MLKTFETKPQVLVDIGGMPAVCHNLTCDYQYTEANGTINSHTFDLATKRVKITGVDLPSNIKHIDSVNFAESPCTIDKATVSGTNIDCVLDRSPVCGDHKPILTTKWGIIPNEASVTATSIECSITGVT